MADDSALDRDAAQFEQHYGLRHSASAAVVSCEVDPTAGSGASTDSDDDSTTHRKSRSARIAAAAASDLVPVSLSGPSGSLLGVGTGGGSSTALMSSATAGTLVASIAGVHIVSHTSPMASGSAAGSAATGMLGSPSSRNGGSGSGNGGVGSSDGLRLRSRSSRSWDAFKVYMAYACAHWSREKYLFVANWRVLLSVIVVQYIHTVAMNAAYYMNTPREPLWDFGFEVLPYVPTDTPWHFARLMLALTAAFVLMPFVRTQQNPRKPVFTAVILARFCMVLILAQALRVITFIVTTLPGPSEKCRPDSPLYHPPRSYYEVFTNIQFELLGVGCGDLVFSSAMIWVVLCALTISHYTHPDACYPPAPAQLSGDADADADPDAGVDGASGSALLDDDRRIALENGRAAVADEDDEQQSPQPMVLRVMRASAWLLVVLFGLSQVAARTHYTLDILVAGYTVPLLWVAVLRYVPDRVPPEFQSELQYGLWTCSCDAVFASPKESVSHGGGGVSGGASANDEEAP